MQEGDRVLQAAKMRQADYLFGIETPDSEWTTTRQALN
jgi:hypothetical protein